MDQGARAVAPHGRTGCVGAHCGASHGYAAASAVEHTDDVALLEVALYGGDTHRQQAHGAVAQQYCGCVGFYCHAPLGKG